MPGSCDDLVVEFLKDSNNSMKFPYFATGCVVKGFGRGSKQLGIPTANYPEDVVDKLPSAFDNGVYYGWAQVDDGPVYKMVMSIGNNPYYNNEKKTMETYVINEFENDFYGSNLKTIMLGHLRPMTSFKNLDELITAIKKDIADAKELLEKPEENMYKSHQFFNNPNVKL
ncbi:unnamed protein product [Brachionus calyciflorus]|uniref:Riboflavin kinase n=1 Tax=Brachionus calyciflorus TaxID=104777 RepID=A0A813X0S6_9BILA|nr:unnamed protein product [Brachionus calyciflorus]